MNYPRNKAMKYFFFLLNEFIIIFFSMHLNLFRIFLHFWKHRFRIKFKINRSIIQKIFEFDVEICYKKFVTFSFIFIWILKNRWIHLKQKKDTLPDYLLNSCLFYQSVNNFSELLSCKIWVIFFWFFLYREVQWFLSYRKHSGVRLH